MIRLLVMLCLCVGATACAGLPVPANEPLPAAARNNPDAFVVVTVRNDDATLGMRAGSTMRGYNGATRYTAGSSARIAVNALASAHHLREVSSWPIAALGIHCVVFELPPNETAVSMIEQLRHDSRVESAQPLQAFATQSSGDNDPYRELQGSLVAMNVIAAHRWSRGAGVRVAVIDTGVDTRHPDLAGRIAGTQNFVDADDRAFNRDRHGTAVAGVIAANSDNQIGIVGVAPQAQLYVYKACWQRAVGTGVGAACNTFTLANALAAAIDDHVHIVNLSLAGPQDPLLTRLVVIGQQRGIIFVGATLPETATASDASAGFPSGISGVLKVASIEHHRTERGTLLAPGAEVLTLVPDGHYDFISGNSLATANVAGAVALLIARDHGMSNDQLQQLLTTSATTTTRRVGATDATERGVNVCAALATLLNKAPCPEAPALSVAAE